MNSRLGTSGDVGTRQTPFWWTTSSILGWLMISSSSVSTMAQDKGLNTPVSNLQNKFADLLAQAEKKIPRSQKYQILNRIRHSLKASKDRNDPRQIIDLANQYKRYRFYPEAIQLFEDVAENSSNDAEWLMRSNRWLGEIKFVASGDTKAAIQHFNRSISYSPEDSLIRGELLGRLGSYYFIDEQVEQMLKTFESFNRLPERIKKALPDSYLKANLYSARFSNEPAESAKLFKKAREIAQTNPKEFPPDFVLSIFSEQNGKQPWNAPSRIERLEMLIENKDFAKEPQIRELAMEVFLAYFLDRKNEWKRFEDFSKRALKLYSKFESKQKNETPTLAFASQTLGTFVGAAEKSKRKWDQTESIDNFQSWQSKVAKMSFYFPNNMKGDDLREIMTAYRNGALLLSKKQSRTPRKRVNKSDQKSM